VEIKGQLDATDLFFIIAELNVRSTCFRHHYAHHQELKIYKDGCCLWYLALWFTGRWSGMELWRNIPQTGHITHSSTPDQRPVNQSAKYHRQQPSV